MKWQFFLDALEIDEPQGFDSFAISISRDLKTHGIMFEASTSNLGFYGAAAAYLQHKRKQEGFNADVTFTAIAVDCPGATFTGRLDFGTYMEDCGGACLVTMSVEQESCFMKFKARYNQAVDLDSEIAFDGLTHLPALQGINMPMTLPPVVIEIGAWGTNEQPVVEDIKSNPFFVPDSGDDFTGYIAPALVDVKNSSYGTFNVSPLIEVIDSGANNIPPWGQGADPSTPVSIGTASIVGDITCALEQVTASFRLKWLLDLDNQDLLTLRLKLWRLPVGLDETNFSNWIEEYNDTIFAGSGIVVQDLDVEAVVPMANVQQGDFFYWGVVCLANDLSQINRFIITQGPETYFKLTAGATCEATEANVYLVHEALSRAVQASTDMCFDFKSTYYGRTDSAPHVYDADGCGALRAITSGLKIRRALHPTMFVSVQDLFEGLRAIDNIGMGVQGSTLVVEAVDFFYKDEAIAFEMPGIPQAKFTFDPQFAYSKIKAGYKRWEINSFNGLDEPNSNKDFRTSLTTIQNELDVTSALVAGSYAIEVTRQQSFADTGAADTTYDNETFIICLERDDAYPFAFHVEQGGPDITNVYRPDSLYNWRIRPRFNLIRWWRSLVAMYVNADNTTSKLFFSAGTGNLLAAGKDAPPCNVAELGESESSDLFQNEVRAEYRTPLWHPLRLECEYPLSLADYALLKAMPYGYIRCTCGGATYKAFILDVNYTLAEGKAKFNLLLKYDGL